MKFFFFTQAQKFNAFNPQEKKKVGPGCALCDKKKFYIYTDQNLQALIQDMKFFLKTGTKGQSC